MNYCTPPHINVQFPEKRMFLGFEIVNVDYVPLRDIHGIKIDDIIFKTWFGIPKNQVYAYQEHPIEFDYEAPHIVVEWPRNYIACHPAFLMAYKSYTNDFNGALDELRLILHHEIDSNFIV